MDFAYHRNLLAVPSFNNISLNHSLFFLKFYFASFIFVYVSDRIKIRKINFFLDISSQSKLMFQLYPEHMHYTYIQYILIFVQEKFNLDEVNQPLFFFRFILSCILLFSLLLSRIYPHTLSHSIFLPVK